MGKTRSGAQAIIDWIMDGYEFVNLAGRTTSDVRDVMIGGESGIIAKAPPAIKPVYLDSKRQLRWPDGRISHCYSADKPEQAQGPQSEKLWMDEIGAWPNQKLYHELKFGLRLGDKPQAIITTTGKRVKLLMEMLARNKQGDKRLHLTRGATTDNAGNLNPEALANLLDRYVGTAYEAMYLRGDIPELEGNPLWNQDQINADRVERSPALVRAGLGWDPSITNKKRSDAHGMVVAGKCSQEELWVLADLSKRCSPTEACEIVVTAYVRWALNVVVAELNRGGDYVPELLKIVAESRGMTLNIVDPECPEYSSDQTVINLIGINSQQDKSNRAEPVAAKYAKRKVHHVGEFTELESEQTEWVPDEDWQSPNRVDGLVFICSELDPVFDRIELDTEFGFL